MEADRKWKVQIRVGRNLQYCKCMQLFKEQSVVLSKVFRHPQGRLQTPEAITTQTVQQTCHMKCVCTSRREHLSGRVVRHVAKHWQILRDTRHKSVGKYRSEGMEGREEGDSRRIYSTGRDISPHKASSRGLIFFFPSYNIWTMFLTFQPHPSPLLVHYSWDKIENATIQRIRKHPQESI